MSSNIQGGQHEYGGVGGNVNSGSGQQTNIYNNYLTAPPPGKLFVGVPPRPALFVGRHELLEAISAALLGGDAALSTHGVGGMGKTALATMLAYNADLLAHFSDGVLWASLGPNPDMDGILNAWGEGLGQPVRDIFERDDKLAALQRAVGQRRLLIILDDVWDKELATQLRRVTGSGCTHLLTTREYLIAHNFAPPSCHDVAELEPEPAIDLLAALCPPARSRRDLLGVVAGDVGYHPLALQLIGGYLASKIVRPSQAERVIATLRQSGAWLNLRDDDRGTDLGQILALSLDSLPDEAARAAFLRLAAFAPKPQSFSFDAAGKVAECDEDTLNLMLHRHLLEQLPDDLERLTLHQTLHALAAARCPDQPATHRAHADYYLALMNADISNLELINKEWAQLTKAFNWVVSTPFVEELIIPYLEIEHERHLLAANEVVNWLEDALPTTRKHGSSRSVAIVLANLGCEIEDTDEAHAYLYEALTIAEDVNDPNNKLNLLEQMGGGFKKLGDKEQAIDCYQRLLPLYMQVGDLRSQITTLKKIGELYDSMGTTQNNSYYQQARNHYQQALQIQHKINDHIGEIDTLMLIAGTHPGLDEFSLCMEYYQQALNISSQNHDSGTEETTRQRIKFALHLSDVQAITTQAEQALGYYQQALPIRRKIGDRSGEAQTLNNIGYIYLHTGDLAQAQANFEQALALSEQVQYPELIAAARNGLEAVRRQLAG